MEAAMPLHEWIEARPLTAGAKRHRDRAQPATALTRGLEALMQFGQIARGLVYAIPGIFALRLALGSRGAAIAGNGIGLSVPVEAAPGASHAQDAPPHANGTTGEKTRALLFA